MVTLWRGRNRVAFDNESPSAHRMKANFISNLWSWENLYSRDRTNSLLEFLRWLGCRCDWWFK